MSIKVQNKQMCQSYHSVSNLSVKSRYHTLCKLHNKYRACVKIALENTPENPIADDMMVVLDGILESIERHPIPWKFYSRQKHKFSQEFEDLVVFTDEISI